MSLDEKRKVLVQHTIQVLVPESMPEDEMKVLIDKINEGGDLGGCLAETTSYVMHKIRMEYADKGMFIEVKLAKP